MGVLGGDWVDDNDTSYELHTDIDVHFTMSGQTDTGLTFGASIDLDESDGGVTGDTPPQTRGHSLAFDGRTQGGEEIFISGAFGTLTMGDTDGALDWALQEIGIGGTLGDAHTSHSGYNGNGFADDPNGGQIVRYDHSFGDFAVALSTSISDDATDEDVLAVGVRYNVSLATMELGIGLGYSQLHHDDAGGENDASGASLDAKFNNGLRAILNWVDMGDTNEFHLEGRQRFSEKYVGVGLGYEMDDWTVAANWGKYSEEVSTLDPGQKGYAVVANYDLGGGAEVQFGYAKSECKSLMRTLPGESSPRRFPLAVTESAYTVDCAQNDDYSRISLGVAMSF